jgi:3-oxoacyl-(acyl-carrier-protein) synthase
MATETKRRVVVTGLGATSPLGGDVPATWQAALARRHRVPDEKTIRTLPDRLTPAHCPGPCWAGDPDGCARTEPVASGA